ncbi:MAG: hypothetical protein M1569_01980 [Candidatus Marsarchaeota archaeon]|nr:hypothetical protein [Candidatus Marsarchaeota archaeon]MCL5413149.1 hypothetical protein [Candidatus Marsarchaeota archaeon]
MVCGNKNLSGESGFCDVQMPFNRKIAESDGIECSVAKAEEKDLRHLVENSCLSCNRFLENMEIKVVPPRYIQDKDRYVKAGAVNRRLMCVQCYNALRSVMHNSVRYKDTPAAKKSFFIRTVINNILLRN